MELYPDEIEKEYILITGATGFIGSHVIQNLLSNDGYCVVAIARKGNNYKNVEALRKTGAIIFEGLFYDKSDIERCFKEFPIKHVIHMAALRGAGKGTKEEYNRINIYGTEVLLEASLKHNVKKFVFFRIQSDHDFPIPGIIGFLFDVNDLAASLDVGFILHEKVDK